MQVKITAIKIIDAKPSSSGTRLIAQFDCEAAGFKLLGCSLIRTTKNGLVAVPPKILDERSAKLRAISFIDSSLRHAVMEASRQAYKALGGTQAEWIPGSQDQAHDA
jgi:hypothetical protein